MRQRYRENKKQPYLTFVNVRSSLKTQLKIPRRANQFMFTPFYKQKLTPVNNLSQKSGNDLDLTTFSKKALQKSRIVPFSSRNYSSQKFTNPPLPMPSTLMKGFMPSSNSRSTPKYSKNSSSSRNGSSRLEDKIRNSKKRSHQELEIKMLNIFEGLFKKIFKIMDRVKFQSSQSEYQYFIERSCSFFVLKFDLLQPKKPEFGSPSISNKIGEKEMGGYQLEEIMSVESREVEKRWGGLIYISRNFPEFFQFFLEGIKLKKYEPSVLKE